MILLSDSVSELAEALETLDATDTAIALMRCIAAVTDSETDMRDFHESLTEPLAYWGDLVASAHGDLR